MLRRALETLYGIYALLALGLIPFVVMALPMMLLPTLHLRRAMGRAGMRLGLVLAGIPYTVRGLEHLPAGNCVVVCNHASYLDGPLLTAALPERFTFVVQHRAAEWPWVGRVIQRMGATFVNREQSRSGARQTRELIRRLQQGQSFAVFPEGSFKADPVLRPFRKGAFMMAVHAGVPVVPAVIRGTRTIYGAGMRLPRWGRIEVEILPPVHVTTAHPDHRHAIVELRDKARDIVLEHCGEPDIVAA